MTTAIFRTYDRTALDAEYNNRLKVKDALDWIDESGLARARAREPRADCAVPAAW